MSDAEHEIVERAKAGDREAFGLLFVPLYRDAWELASHLLGSRGEAEDAVQTTYVKALRGIAGYAGEASPRGWFLKICRYECIDRLRRRTVPKPVDVGDQETRTQPLDPLLEEGEDRSSGAYRGCWRDRFRAQTTGDPCERWDSSIDERRARDRLSPEEDEAYFLVDVMGCTREEAAEIVGVAASTMRSRVVRARNLMVLAKLDLEIWGLYHSHDGNVVVVSCSEGTPTAGARRFGKPFASLLGEPSSAPRLPRNGNGYADGNGYDLVWFLNRVAGEVPNGKWIVTVIDDRSTPREQVSVWAADHPRWCCLRLAHGAWRKEVRKLLEGASRSEDHADQTIALVDGPKPFAWVRSDRGLLT